MCLCAIVLHLSQITVVRGVVEKIVATRVKELQTTAAQSKSASGSASAHQAHNLLDVMLAASDISEDHLTTEEVTNQACHSLCVLHCARVTGLHTRAFDGGNIGRREEMR